MTEGNETNNIYSNYNITLYSVGSIIFVADIAFSILYIVVVYKKDLYQKKIFISLLSWVGADLLFAVLLSIQIVTIHIDWLAKENLGLCLLWNGIQVYPLWVSNLHAVLCAMDRYIAVLYPNKYELRLSNSRLRVYIGCCWGYGILWTCLPYIWYGKDMGNQLCNLCSLNHIYIFLLVMLDFIPTMIACLFLYTKVFIHFKRHERQVHVTHTLTQDELVDNTKLARTISCITIFYGLTWLPFSLISFVRASNLSLNSDWHIALLYAYLIGIVGCLAKLPLFTVFNQDFCAGLKETLHMRKKPLQFGSSLQQ